MTHRHLARALVGIGIASLCIGCAGKRAADTIAVPATGDSERRVVELDRSWVPTTLTALRASPGCLGAEAAQMGFKRAIFAMFRDKDAAIAWYRSQAHLSLADRVRPAADYEHHPLSRVPHGTGPILVIATMQPEHLSKLAGQPQLLSVELFTPLDAGIRFGGASFLPLPTISP